jgi:hypothetical protein
LGSSSEPQILEDGWNDCVPKLLRTVKKESIPDAEMRGWFTSQSCHRTGLTLCRSGGEILPPYILGAELLQDVHTFHLTWWCQELYTNGHSLEIESPLYQGIANNGAV